MGVGVASGTLEAGDGRAADGGGSLDDRWMSGGGSVVEKSPCVTTGTGASPSPGVCCCCAVILSLGRRLPDLVNDSVLRTWRSSVLRDTVETVPARTTVGNEVDKTSSPSSSIRCTVICCVPAGTEKEMPKWASRSAGTMISQAPISVTIRMHEPARTPGGQSVCHSIFSLGADIIILLPTTLVLSQEKSYPIPELSGNYTPILIIEVYIYCPHIMSSRSIPLPSACN